MKVGVTTFGGDGGRSGIGTYIVHLMAALTALDPDIVFEMVGHENERETFLPPSTPMTFLPVHEAWRRPIPNVAWHQVALPRVFL